MLCRVPTENIRAHETALRTASGRSARLAASVVFRAPGLQAGDGGDLPVERAWRVPPDVERHRDAGGPRFIRVERGCADDDTGVGISDRPGDLEAGGAARVDEHLGPPT